jgi:hypothetical protein
MLAVVNKNENVIMKFVEEKISGCEIIILASLAKV